MKQTILRVKDLVNFMGEGTYLKFIEYIQQKKHIPKSEPIWIILEWSGTKNEN